MTSAIKTCNDNKVYLAQFFRIISERTAQISIRQQKIPLITSEQFMKMSRQTVKTLVNILLDKGDRNIGLIGWEQGDATWLGRWEGYKAGVDKWNERTSGRSGKVFLSHSTQVQLQKVVPKQQKL